MHTHSHTHNPNFDSPTPTVMTNNNRCVCVCMCTGSDRASVCLVDHQQVTQFAECLREDQVCGIIDHHSLQTKTVTTGGPIYIDVRPWGSACTILAFEFFQAHRVSVPASAS
jgi:inorganic pyrophosphatase/exopolyphosphatase